MAALQYAYDHGGTLPNDLSPLSNNLPVRLLTSLQTNMNVSQFELVYHGPVDVLTNYAHPGEILMVRERQPWRNKDGKWVKAYVATDGSGLTLSRTDGQFEEWEKRHILTGDPRSK
jgi:hypothetical protein